MSRYIYSAETIGEELDHAELYDQPPMRPRLPLSHFLPPEERQKVWAAHRKREALRKLKEGRRHRLRMNHLKLHHTFGYEIGGTRFPYWDEMNCGLWGRGKCRFR